jgi:hypothetical protein
MFNANLTKAGYFNASFLMVTAFTGVAKRWQNDQKTEYFIRKNANTF